MKAGQHTKSYKTASFKKKQMFVCLNRLHTAPTKTAPSRSGFTPSHQAHARKDVGALRAMAQHAKANGQEPSYSVFFACCFWYLQLVLDVFFWFEGGGILSKLFVEPFETWFLEVLLFEGSQRKTTSLLLKDPSAALAALADLGEQEEVGRLGWRAF